MENWGNKIRDFLNSRFSKKQQTLGAFAILILLCIFGIFVALTSDYENKSVHESNQDTPVIKESDKPVRPEDVPEENVFVPNPEDQVEDDPEINPDDYVTKLDGATEINVPEIQETLAELIDSSENYALFIGYGGVLSILNKSDHSFKQIDNPVSVARISDDEEYIVYAKREATSSQLIAYSFDEHKTERILELEDEYISDVAMAQGVIYTVHHKRNSVDYNLQTFTHLEYREDMAIYQQRKVEINNVGPKLYQKNEKMYYYSMENQGIHHIIPNLYDEKIADVPAKVPSDFAIDKDLWGLVDDGVLKIKQGNIFEEAVNQDVSIYNGVLYFSNNGGLFRLTGNNREFLTSQAFYFTEDNHHFVIQDVEKKVYLWKK